MLKKIIGILSIFAVLLASIGAPISATTSIDTSNKPNNAYWEYWEIASTKKNSFTKDLTNWEICFVGQPAKRAGETQTATASYTENAEVTGQFQLSKGVIAGSVGVSLGTSYTRGGSANSPPLALGQYVIGYSKLIATVHEVSQRKYIHMDGQNIPTNMYATAYVEVPNAVSVKLEYYSSSSFSPLDNEVQPYKVEYYLIEDGIAELIKTEIK